MSRFALRIKVKHLLLFAAVGFAAILALGAVKSYAVDELLERGLAAYHDGDYERSLLLLDRYLERCPDCPGTADALFYSALALPSPRAEAYVFSNGRGSWSSDPRPESDVAGAEERLQRVVREFPQATVRTGAILRLLDMFIEDGRWDDAEKLLALPHVRIPFKNVVFRKEIDLVMARGDHRRAIELAEEYNRVPPGGPDVEVLFLIGDAYLALGLIDEAKEAYDEAADFRNEQWRELIESGRLPPQIDTDRDYLLEELMGSRKLRLEQAEAAARQPSGIIEGRVQGIGSGVTGLEIMIGPSRHFGNVHPPRPGTFETITPDAQGRFQLRLPPDSYTVGMRYIAKGRHPNTVTYRGPDPVTVEAGQTAAVEFVLLGAIEPLRPEGFVRVSEDAVDVAWHPVPGAQRYVVHFGITARRAGGSSTMSSSLLETTDTEVRLTPTVLRWTGLAGARSYYGSDSFTAEWAFLGAFHPESEAFMYIEAHDAEGLIAASYVGAVPPAEKGEPLDVTALGPLSPEERLILERRFDEAVPALMNRLDKDPQDLAAAMILFRLHAYGTDAAGRGRDPEAARAMRERILAMGVPEAIKRQLPPIIGAEPGGRTEVDDDRGQGIND